jgi:hypothetical protein
MFLTSVDPQSFAAACCHFKKLANRIHAGLMQVSETLPPFTLRLSKVFVNRKQRISTGFLRFLSVFLENLAKKARFTGIYTLRLARLGLKSEARVPGFSIILWLY